MEEFNQLRVHSNHRESFFHASALLAGDSSPSNNGRLTNGGSRLTQIAKNNFHGESFQPDPIDKAEAFTSIHRDRKFYSPLIESHQSSIQRTDEFSDDFEAIKAKITAHPKYFNLLEAYMDCRKVGAPSEVAASLAEARRKFETRQPTPSTDNSKDPELDQFMEAYYDMLVKFREEITRPIQEATDFMHRIECQLNTLCNDPLRIFTSGEKCQSNWSSEEEPEKSGGETEPPEMDPMAENRELKDHLLRKYSGYLSSLKKELSKKKKKGKLPKEARQKLLNWWELHYKWPYPSEAEKAALVESTGLHLKQINNWFINQRKRHWKPEDPEFMAMEGLYSANGGLCINPHFG